MNTNDNTGIDQPPFDVPLGDLINEYLGIPGDLQEKDVQDKQESGDHEHREQSMRKKPSDKNDSGETGQRKDHGGIINDDEDGDDCREQHHDVTYETPKGGSHRGIMADAGCGEEEEYKGVETHDTFGKKRGRHGIIGDNERDEEECEQHGDNTKVNEALLISSDEEEKQQRNSISVTRSNIQTDSRNVEKAARYYPETCVFFFC